MNNNVNPKIKNPIMIFAGYKEQINDFLKMNPDLNFADFTPEELCDIHVCYSNLCIAPESSHCALSINGIADYTMN